MPIKRSAIVAAFVLAILMPSTARADGLFSAFLGPVFAGDTINNKLTYGASIGSMGGVAGFEVDFGYTPDFFKPEGAGDDALGSKTNVTTLMGNLIVGAGKPGAGIRPYVVGGAGLIRSNVSGVGDLFEDLSKNSFGIDFGFGVNGFVSHGVGIKGDVRYFRSLTGSDDSGVLGIDLGDFDFWRGTVGVVFRF
jgi:hypothetical protein